MRLTIDMQVEAVEQGARRCGRRAEEGAGGPAAGVSGPVLGALVRATLECASSISLNTAKASATSNHVCPALD